ncbi:MAG: type II 3-dehydroquinate dehydratase [Lachnospiraceae bacterium]|nr:type II 3-dehydroquinate dehydratase [Lachnospiraceae bacterium]
MKVMVINGPNLDMLGYREPEVYGSKTYKDLCDYIGKAADELGISVDFYQSNYEGGIVETLHKVFLEKYDGVIINAGAYTHYSYAIRDAIAILNCPVVEVHISDVMNREDFRKISVIEEVCSTRCFGRGFDSYIDALKFIVK